MENGDTVEDGDTCGGHVEDMVTGGGRGEMCGGECSQ